MPNCSKRIRERVCVQGITDAASKQKIIAELYQRFFRLALPETHKNLGIVYTPVEVVDYIVRSVEDILNQEFRASVSDEGVHVLDPFVGTGTFITRLLRSGVIKPEDLKRKYDRELHANDIMLLAYYVAAINIESTYHDLADADEYQPFNGIVLTDTFQSYEEGDPMDQILFPRNNERIERQKGLDIRVIVGNPPWSATKNRAYQTIDQQVQHHYVATSKAMKLSALYDPYIRAIRLASDRIEASENGGIIAFVSNGGFLESIAFDGFRKALSQEFHAIYCLNLRGDQRTSGEKSLQEGGKVFGSDSRASVAILLLVKKAGKSDGAVIHYHDIGSYLKREEKLEILKNSRLSTTTWQIITPNEAADWINQRSKTFPALRRLTAEKDITKTNRIAPIFNLKTVGIVTSRDAWSYNLSLGKLRSNIRGSVNFYNEQVAAFKKTSPIGSIGERASQAKAFIGNTPEQFHWSRENYRDLANGKTYTAEETSFTIGVYRPFFKQNLYFNKQLINSIRKFPEIYPKPEMQNLTISIMSPGASGPFTTLMTDSIPNTSMLIGREESDCYPRWRYASTKNLEALSDTEITAMEQVSNINAEALTQFQKEYTNV